MPATSPRPSQTSFKVRSIGLPRERLEHLIPVEIYDEYEDDPSESESDGSITDSDEEENDTPTPAKKPKAAKTEKQKKKGRNIASTGAI